MLSKEGHARLIDFGNSRLVENGPIELPPQNAGFASPEVRSNQKAALPSDIWSFGVILVCMLKGQRPGLLQFIVPILKLNFSRLTIFAHFDMQMFDSKIVFRRNNGFLSLVIREL